MQRKANLALAPRKKPLQARAVATVEAILQAAAHILETDGLTACSTNSVAAKAGVSIGSLYQYFPSRDAITKALIIEQVTTLMEKLEAIRLEEGGRVALEQLIDIAIAQQLTRPALAKILDAEEQRLPVEADLRGYAASLHTMMLTILAQPDMPQGVQFPEVAADLLAIIRGMVDAAGARGDWEIGTLRQRVQRAVFGYLTWK